METTPKLSQYFGADPNTIFDDITTPAKEISNITSTTFDGTFKTTDYIELIDTDDDLKVTDDVRNFWLFPIIENDQLLLTSPSVLNQEDLSDPIIEAVSFHLTEKELSQRIILTVDNVTQDERGLRQLISAHCFRSAINLTGRLLKIYGQGYGRSGNIAKHTTHSLQLWFTRLALLAKLGQFELLEKEAMPFDQLNRHDLFFEHYPEMYENKKGSMGCFSFRLLLAELPIYFGAPKTAMDRLTELSSICNEIKNYFKLTTNDNYEFWRRREIRILHSIINCGIMMRDFSLIDDIMKTLLQYEIMKKDEKRSLYSAWGRIYLQIGDIFGAEQKFSEARRIKEINSSLDLRDLVDKGLIAVAQNDFQKAYNSFHSALQLENGNAMLLNNMGVCLLYSSKLKEAIKIFENAINVNPQKSLNESLLINLSTLYELESSDSKIKKINLLKLLNKYKPDLNISLEFCLKLPLSNN